MGMLENRFRYTVDAAGVTLRGLARSSGVSFNTVWKIYHEKTSRIDFDTLDRLCRDLNCQVTGIIAWRPAD